MKLREWVAAGAIVVLGLMLLTMTAMSGSHDMDDFLMIAGDTDSTEQATRWIPIKGASRVILRSWSTYAGFGGNVDSAKVDSIAGWKVLFSDSICCNVAGFEHGTGSPRIPSAADSIVNAAAAADTAKYGIGIYELPVNKPLRGATNGSGILTFVAPIQPGSLLAAHGGTIGKGYMRVRFTPLRRSTGATSEATVPNRANGLRGFKMIATVVRDNR